eukprot:3902555-Rhodomonas_salina.2
MDYQNLASVGPHGNRREDLISQTDFIQTDVSNLVSSAVSRRACDVKHGTDKGCTAARAFVQAAQTQVCCAPCLSVCKCARPILTTRTAPGPPMRVHTIERAKVSSTMTVRGGSSPALIGTGRQRVVNHRETAKKQKKRLLSEVKKVALHSVDEHASVSLASMPGVATGKPKKLIDHEALEKMIEDLEEDDDEVRGREGKGREEEGTEGGKEGEERGRETAQHLSHARVLTPPGFRGHRQRAFRARGRVIAALRRCLHLLEARGSRLQYRPVH